MKRTQREGSGESPLRRCIEYHFCAQFYINELKARVEPCILHPEHVFVFGVFILGGYMQKLLFKIISFVITLAILAYFLYNMSYSIGTVTIIIILIIFIAAYGVLFGISQRSSLKLARIIDSDNRTMRQLILFSIGSMLPMYFCYAIASFIPMFQYEVWFITVFPLIIIHCVPLYAMADELKRTHMPISIYWSIHIAILILTFTVLQVVSNIVLKSFI